MKRQSFTKFWKPLQFSSGSQSCPTLCDPTDHSTPGLPVYHHLPEFTQTHVHWVGDAIQPSHPLSSPSPPTFNLSQHQGLFQGVHSSHQVAIKYWSCSFSISPSNEYSGLISFRMDWLDLLAVQGTLKSLLQHHSSKTSILRCSAFFIVQVSCPFRTPLKVDLCSITVLTVGELHHVRFSVLTCLSTNRHFSKPGTMLVVLVVKVTQSCLTLATSWTGAHQVSLPMGFSRQEYWSRLPFPFPGHFPNPGITVLVIHPKKHEK